MNAPQEFPPIHDLLRRLGIRLERRKSQHFLKRQEVCTQIAELAGLGREHLAIEVGAGLGNLTVEIAARAGKVYSVEMDEAFAEWHDYLSTAHQNLTFIRSDFLKLDLDEMIAASEWRGPVVGIGNLPYQITGEILFRFVDAAQRFDSLVFMVQKEVADRVCGGPGRRSAGALTYKIAMRYKAELALHVAAGQFLPPPQVESAVMVLRPLETPVYTSLEERRHVYTMVDRLFMYRRKTLLNSLAMGGCVAGKDAAAAALSRAGIEESRRPETLSLEEMMRLARVIAADQAP